MGFFDKIFGKETEKPVVNSTKELEWYKLNNVESLEEAIEYSNIQPILLFKHSTRCSISSSALDRLSRNWQGEKVNVKSFYLDLLNHRDISSAIADKLSVEHQSPQMILVKNGEVIFYSSHSGINFSDVQNYFPA